MEENFFVKDCMSSNSASSAQLTHISNENKTSTNFNQPTFNLNKFKIDDGFDTDKKTLNYLIIGNTRHGKNDMIKILTRKIHSKINLSKIYLFTNIHINDYTDTFTNVELAKDNIDTLKNIIEDRKKNPTGNEPILIILDDLLCIYKNNLILNNLFFNEDYLNINIIIHTQYPVKYYPTIVNTFNCVFIFIHSYDNIKRFYEWYVGNLIGFNMFNTMMKAISVGEFLVIHNDSFTWYKPELVDSSQLLSLSEMKNNEKIMSGNDKIESILQKINKNNLLIQILTDENKRLLYGILV